MTKHFTRMAIGGAFLLCSAMAQAQEPAPAATDVVSAPATLSMPVRGGDSKDYTKNASVLLELWSSDKLDIPDGYYCPIRFDMSAVTAATASGKVVKSARLRLTHCGDKLTPTVAVRQFATSSEWNASSTVEEIKTLVTTAYTSDPVATGTVAFKSNMLDAAKAAFADMTCTMSDYQGYVDITDYVKANAEASEINVMLTNAEVKNTNKSQIWLCNPKNTMQYNDGKFKDNWDAMLKAFNMTEEEFIEAVKPTIEVELSTPSNYASDTSAPIADCWLRNQEKNYDKNNNTEYIETWTNTSSSSHAYGLVGFTLPQALSYKDITTVNSAKLRFVTRKYTNDNEIGIYSYTNDFAEKTATYNTEKDYVTAALATEPILTVSVAGKKNTDLVYGTGDYQDVAKWTNEIDLTSLLKGSVNGSRLNLLFKPKADSNNIMFYSKDVKDKTFNNTEITVPAADLTPQLTISYTVGYKLTVGEAGAATLCLPFEAQIPEGIKAYRLTGVANGVVTTEQVTGTLLANTPVLVMAVSGEYDFNAVDADVNAKEAKEGVLTGTYEEKTVPSGGYILTYADNKLAFRKVDGETNKVDPYRAYLSVTESEAKVFTLDFDSNPTPTGIAEAYKAEAAGQDNTIYNLAGQRVAKGSKGLVVRNGKVVIIK